MQIHGFNKTTLLDFPGIVGCTIFTGSCNFRCPYCQNADLVLNPNSQPLISEEEILTHLRKRKGITRGICISGGEPTLQQDLEDFILKCRETGLLVKLDTNGYRPEVLNDLLKKGLLDYVAMDIKAPLSSYEKAAGVRLDTDRIKESVNLIKRSGIEYEFRTTVVRELHDKEDFLQIGELLKGAKKYFLQGYVDSERVISPGFTSYSYEEMCAFRDLLKDYIEQVEVRGVE